MKNVECACVWNVILKKINTIKSNSGFDINSTEDVHTYIHTYIHTHMTDYKADWHQLKRVILVILVEKFP